MLEYIQEIKQNLSETYNFRAIKRSDGFILSICEDIPDGVYPMKIHGKVDNVAIIDGKINCCNFEDEK